MEAIMNGAPTLEATPVSRDDNCHQIGGDGGAAQGNEAGKLSSYEQLREERIKENLVRMQQLGLFDLSLKLKSAKPPRKNSCKSPGCKNPGSPLPPSEPRRRSSRLQNTTPVSYCEVSSRKDASSKVELNFLKEGPMPEVYTDEHDKLLGSTNMSWTLFVDGYGQDGKRIYDPVQGKTCHQCRQKTLGHRTRCSKCDMVQGQFCGDCLYMRYGEHVLEAKQNPNWICPVCRGICNCSLCRTGKGWAPTGALYKKISQLGFKSVAHYLIQTRQSQTNPDQTPGTNIPVSAKRSLAFSDMEPPSEKGSPVSNDYHHGLVTHVYEEKKAVDDEFKGEKWEETHFSETKRDATNIASAATQEPIKMQLNTASCDYLMALSKPESEDDKTDNMLEGEGENKHGDNIVGEESTPKSKGESPVILEPATDSIAGRLRQSLAGNLHENVNGYPRADDDEFRGEKCEETHISETEHYTSSIASVVTQEPKKYAVDTVSCDCHKAVLKPEPEDVKSESKLDGKFDENKHSDNNVAEGRTPTLKRKSPRLPEQAPDSIAGRLRQRRRRGNVHDEELIGVNKEK